MDDERSYDAPGITVTWSKARCIHAAECVRGLPNVFSPRRRPWIEPTAAEAEAIAEVVRRCPTGALHATRPDGRSTEPTPASVAIEVRADGPLTLRGDLRLADAEGREITRDTRLALCRCGASRHKPYCDGSHHKAAFVDEGHVAGEDHPPATDPLGPVTLAPVRNGPVIARGHFVLTGADGRRVALDRAAFCRCGASGSKPLCDGSHARIGFTTD